VTAEHVHAAIAEAETKRDEAQCCYDEFARNSSEEDLAYGWPDHASIAEWEAATLARIQAVLLCAIYIEGVVNAWGVYVAGEDFFKAYIERCTLESKIALTLALDGKGCIPKNHSAMLAVRELFVRRNQIAHRKTKELQTEFSPNHVREIKANSDLAACKTALDAFHKLLLEVGAAFMAGVHGRKEAP
jgi:hypothetical protein